MRVTQLNREGLSSENWQGWGQRLRLPGSLDHLVGHAFIFDVYPEFGAFVGGFNSFGIPGIPTVWEWKAFREMQIDYGVQYGSSCRASGIYESARIGDKWTWLKGSDWDSGNSDLVLFPRSKVQVIADLGCLINAGTFVPVREKFLARLNGGQRRAPTDCATFLLKCPAELKEIESVAKFFAMAFAELGRRHPFYNFEDNDPFVFGTTEGHHYPRAYLVRPRLAQPLRWFWPF